MNHTPWTRLALPVAICVGFACSLSTCSSSSAEERAPIVIVHGAWGGAHHWKEVGDRLAIEHDRIVRRVSLTGLGERSHLATKDVGLATHIQDVVNAVEFDDLESIILVGHSYGGVVAAGVANAIPERIAKVIYIDSHLLENGENYLTHHSERRAQMVARANEDGDGWLIPVDWKNPMRDTPHPLKTLLDPIQLDASVTKDLPQEYWLLADGKPAEDDERFRYLVLAQKRGWPTKTLAWNHNPHRSRPADFVVELLDSLKR